MLKYDADPSSPTTAASDSTHKPCDQCESKYSSSAVQNINASTTGWYLLRMMAADWDNMVIKHHQLMMNMLHIPDHQSLLNLKIQTL